MVTGGDGVGRRRVEPDAAARRLRAGVGGVLGVLVAAVLLPVAGPALVAVAAPAPAVSTAPSPAPTAAPDRQDDDAGSDTTTPSLEVDPAPTATPTGPVYANPVPAPGSPAPGAPSPTPTAPTVALTIADPGDITTTLGRFSGTGTPGHGVRVADPVVRSASVCRTTVTPGGSWSCVGRVQSGPARVFTALDTTDATLPAAAALPTDVIVPPVVTTDRPTTGSVVGTGAPGSTVTVSRAGSSAVRSATVGPDGGWRVSWGSGPGVPDDGQVSLSAVQTASTAHGYRSELRSAASTPRTVTLDRSAPAAPRVTSPVARSAVGADRLRVVGTAEPGSTVTVYVDSSAVCRDTVGADGAWSCRVADRLAPGAHRLLAGATDAAGNTSRASGAVPVTVARNASADADPTPGATRSPAGAHHPASDSASGPRPTGLDGTGAPGTDGAAGTGGGPASAGTTAGSDDAGALGGPRDRTGSAGDWSVATAYDHAVPTIQSSASWRTVGLAVAVAAAFLFVVAGPLALLAGVLRHRLPRLPARFTGRNRPRTATARSEDTLPVWVSVTVSVGLAGLLTVLGTGVALEARYLRLTVGVLAGTAVLAVAVVLATRWAAGTDRRAVTVRVSPWLVLAAVVASAVTRAGDLSPALLVGVLLVPVARTDLDTGALRLGAGIAASARSATWRSVTLLLVAVAGWVLHSAVPSDGFGGSLVSEFASTLCIGGLGALVVTLLPVRGSAGAALVAAGRARWAALSATAVALATAVATGGAGAGVPTSVLMTMVAVGVVAGAATLAWRRTARRPEHVEPVRAS